MVQRGLTWLAHQQRPDGGWGESCLSDTEQTYIPLGQSIPSQTAWALMGLMAYPNQYGQVIARGVAWLLRHQRGEGSWEERHYTGTGFPGHFYIRYHGYRYYFPLMALGLYQQLLAHREGPRPPL